MDVFLAWGKFGESCDVGTQRFFKMYPLKTSSLPLKIDGWKMKFPSKMVDMSYFGGYVRRFKLGESSKVGDILEHVFLPSKT